MRLRNMVFVLFLAVTVVGFFMAGQAQALSFDNWKGTWFKVKMSETGKAGPVVPPGGEVATNNEKTTTSYLVIDSYDISITAFAVVYCVFNGSAWVNNTATWPVLGGEPEHFLTLFSYQMQESPNVLQDSWIPLEIKGKASNNAPNYVNSASFKNLGGIFLEEINSTVSYGGIGSMKFTGSFINPDQVTGTVPLGCLER